MELRGRGDGTERRQRMSSMSNDITAIRSLDTTRWAALPTRRGATSIREAGRTSVASEQRRPSSYRLLAEHFFAVVVSSIPRGL